MKQVVGDEYGLYKECNLEGWFTHGDNEQYSRMFKMLDDPQFSNRDIAIVIWICSDKQTDLDNIENKISKFRAEYEVEIDDDER